MYHVGTVIRPSAAGRAREHRESLLFLFSVKLYLIAAF